MSREPYTLEELEKEPVDDIWGADATRIVVTKESVIATLNDNARLRALIKSVEYGDNYRDSNRCPWCDEEAIGMRYEKPPHRPAHTAKCPAFTPEGEVR